MPFRGGLLGVVECGHSNSADQEAQSGEWPTFRRNGSLDGHAAGKGRITAPRIVWRKYVGRTETQLLVEPATAPSVLTVPPGSETVTRAKEVSQRRWSPDRPYGQIAGQRQPILPTATETYADIFPEIPGLEKIEVASGFNLPTRNGQWEAGPARCLAWKAGRWNLFGRQVRSPIASLPILWSAISTAMAAWNWPCCPRTANLRCPHRRPEGSVLLHRRKKLRFPRRL